MTAEQVKQALRAKSTAILQQALAAATAANKAQAAQWVREVLAERGVAA